MARIPGFEELIRRFIEGLKDEESKGLFTGALGTPDAPPERTFPIGPVGGIQSAIDITKNIGSKVVEKSKQANQIAELGERLANGDITIGDYIDRVQETQLSQGSLFGLSSAEDKSKRKFSFNKNQRRPSGRPPEKGYDDRAIKASGDRNLYQTLEGVESSLIGLEEFLYGALEHVNSGLVEPGEGPDLFTLKMQQEVRETRVQGVQAHIDTSTDLARIFTTYLEGMSQGISYLDTEISVPTGAMVEGNPEMMSLKPEQIKGYITQFVEGAEKNIYKLIPEYSITTGADKKVIGEVSLGGTLIGTGEDEEGNFKPREWFSYGTKPETAPSDLAKELPTDPQGSISDRTPHTGGILAEKTEELTRIAELEQENLLEVDKLRGQGVYPPSDANKATLENHFLFGGFDTGRESEDTILQRIGADLEGQKLLNTEADPSIQQDIIEYYEGEKGQLTANPEAALKEYSRQQYKDTPGMYAPVQLSEEMLESLKNHKSGTVRLWAFGEPLERNLKIGGYESLKVDKALDHVMEFNRWHKDKFGVPFFADMRNLNNDPLLPSNIEDLSAFQSAVHPQTFKNFIVDKFYQNFPDSSKGQFILDEDMDKVLLDFTVEPYEQEIKADAAGRSSKQIEKDLAKVRDLINSGKLDLVPNERGVITASEKYKDVKGVPKAYKAFIRKWRRAETNIGVGRKILDQLNKSAGLGLGRKQNVAEDALDAWDLIMQVNMDFDARKPNKEEISRELQGRLDAAFTAWVRQEPVDWREPRTDLDTKRTSDLNKIFSRLEPLFPDDFYRPDRVGRWGN